MTNNRPTAYAKGKMGEDYACEYLQQRGMAPLDRRYHSPFGEIDLVMLDGTVLVFVEVKARERASAENALYAITPKKQQRIIETARCYLGEHPEHASRPIRFDALVLTKGQVTHIPDAFRGSEW